MRRQGTRLALSGVAVLLMLPIAHSQALGTARSLARQGKVDAALQETQKSGASAEAQTLACRLYASVGQIDDAIHACEAAHAAKPTDSQTTLELARVYGAKAEHAGTFTGMRMVGRIRENFEAAVQQDGRNVDALSDLGEFYVNAPAIVGGGTDKARALVPRLQAVSPARAARLEGMIAVKNGDMGAADAAFARELSASHSPESYVDLANFDRRRKLYDQAEKNAVLAIQHDTAHGPDSLDAAQILIGLKRSMPVAEKALRDYLSYDQSSAVAEFARVHVLLGQLLQSRGDSAGAHEQYAAALALAGGYEPARKAMRG